MENSRYLSPLQTKEKEEEMRKRRVLGIKLDRMTDGEHMAYGEVLRSIRNNKTKEGSRVEISIDDKLWLADKIMGGKDVSNLLGQHAIPGTNPIKMEREFGWATDRNDGRPPIGGAQD